MNAKNLSIKTTDKRRFHRYSIAATALFTWSHQDGAIQDGHGVTRDIDAAGVYVFANDLPPAGALVEVEIMVPKLTDAGSGMHLCGEGVVLRVEPGSVSDGGFTHCGFAASVSFYPKTEGVVASVREERVV